MERIRSGFDVEEPIHDDPVLASSNHGEARSFDGCVIEGIVCAGDLSSARAVTRSHIEDAIPTTREVERVGAKIATDFVFAEGDSDCPGRARHHDEAIDMIGSIDVPGTSSVAALIVGGAEGRSERKHRRRAEVRAARDRDHESGAGLEIRGRRFEHARSSLSWVDASVVGRAWADVALLAGVDDAVAADRCRAIEREREVTCRLRRAINEYPMIACRKTSSQHFVAGAGREVRALIALHSLLAISAQRERTIEVQSAERRREAAFATDVDVIDVVRRRGRRVDVGTESLYVVRRC
jgi:hypothetical protein